MHGIVDNTGRPQTVPTYLSVKDDAWRKRVIDEIKLNTNKIENLDSHILNGRYIDPLPNVREFARQLSNEEAFRYMRQCRLVTAKLRQAWVEINEEIKALTRSKTFLESALEHIRKNVIINHDTIQNRTHRPAKEVTHDAIDEMLEAEKRNLLMLKRNLEISLKNCKFHLSKMNDARETVFKHTRERQHVTELICQCFTQAMRNNELQNERNKLQASQTSFGYHKSKSSLNSRSMEYPKPTDSINNAFTPAIAQILDTVAHQTAESSHLRENAKILIDATMDNSKSTANRVDDLFVKKISETTSLSQNLAITLSENKLAQNRALRWSELSNISLKYSLGPEKSGSVQLYEKLDRPIMKNFQRHAGNQLSEAQEILKATNALTASYKKTSKSAKTLSIIGQQLSSNLKDKEDVVNIESNLLRRRRQLANHKWTPVKYVKENR